AYNHPTAGMTEEERKANEAPYTTMVSGMEAIWKEVTDEGLLPYIVPVSPGWDSRPWYVERALVRANPRPRLYYQMCEAAKKYVNPKLNMVIAECWNEFGEGSYVEPTTQFGFGALDAMRDAFCTSQNPHHDDVTPQSLGLSAPVFDEVPRPSDVVAESGGNLLYNADIEGNWGWITYAGLKPADTFEPHGGSKCLRVGAGEGVKCQWTMPLPESGTVRVQLWYRAPQGATLAVYAALFTGQRWLQRYADIAVLESTDGQWAKLDTTLTVTDPEATHIDIEFRAANAPCHVDDIDIRAIAP
ncbi:MAG: hypothetical protein GY851_14255, partial [bacterium]|nr:hypothetical protein [bacterium]